MAGKLLIDAHYSDETRIAIIGENGKLENFEAEYSDKKPIKGNIYLAKVVRIEPAIQAAFIDYGGGKNGFLPFSEIHYDYFNKNVLKSLENEEHSEEFEQETEEGTEEKKTISKRQLKIQEVISTKQIILVQAEKEVRGNKCAFFTTFISVPGRYCVLMPNPPKGKNNGISKKIEASEKERLREIVSSLEVPEGMNCIIRTAGENRTKQEIKRDLEYLYRLWNEIRDRVTSSVAPILVHEEGNIIKRVIRDLYQRTMDKIVVQGKLAYKESRAFMKTFTPSHVKKIELYDDSADPIFHKYEIEDKIGKILEPTVILPSGGSIVINTTEALTAIDVNSGKSKHERDIGGTALKTNLEAAVEIGRQIKLRDIAGIIVIDFIDMEERQANIKVEKKMRDAMRNDYSSIQFSRLSQFGLMEISRQRLRTSLADATFIQCSHCGGSGKILANETVALSVIRKIENSLVKENAKSILVEVAPNVDLFILNHKRKLISEMESSYNVSIEITRNSVFSPMDCKVIVKEYNPKDISANSKQNKKSTKKDSKTEAAPVAENESEKLVNKSNVKKQKVKVNENTKTEDSEVSALVPEAGESKPKPKRKRFKKKPKVENPIQEVAIDNSISEQPSSEKNISKEKKVTPIKNKEKSVVENKESEKDLDKASAKSPRPRNKRRPKTQPKKPSESADSNEKPQEKVLEEKKQPVESEKKTAPEAKTKKQSWLKKIFT